MALETFSFIGMLRCSSTSRCSTVVVSWILLSFTGIYGLSYTSSSDRLCPKGTGGFTREGSGRGVFHSSSCSTKVKNSLNFMLTIPKCWIIQVLKSYHSNTTVLLIVQMYINIGPTFMYICTINKTVVLDWYDFNTCTKNPWCCISTSPCIFVA